MTIWGFSISTPRAVNYDKNDKSMSIFVENNVPSAKLCIGCGACTASCTSHSLTDFNIRRTQMLMKRGENSLAMESLNKCMLCGKCSLVCPRGVDTRRMILYMSKYLDKIK